MSDRPLVDVGVVTWNTRDLTVQALRTLLDTDQGVDIRVHVFDNNSSDGTVDALRAHVPEAEVVASPRNVGFGAGHNALIARTDAPFYFCLNSDAWPEPSALATLVSAAAAHPHAAAIAPRLETPEGALELSTHPFPSTRLAATVNLGLHRLMSRQRRADALLDGWWQHDHARVVDWAVGAALLMRRSALEVIGGFDERFFMYAEDLEWGWRVHAKGYETWFEPTALVRHVGNASGQQLYKSQRTAAYLRNTHRFYRDARGRGPDALYRLLEAFGCAKQWARLRLRGRRHEAGAWKQQMLVHLSPIGDEDGPPLR